MAKNILNVSMTDDLTLTFDFKEKVIGIISKDWKIRRREEEPQQFFLKPEKAKPKLEELPSNKKVRPSKQETQFDKFIQLFTLLDEMDTLDEGVSYGQIKQYVISKGIAKEIGEINNLINDALSKDIIQGTEKFGYYKLKT